MEPMLAKAARKLGVDQVAIRRINAPEGKAKFGPANARGQRAYATSAFVKEALDQAPRLFHWDERKAQGGKRQGTKVRGVGVAMSTFVAGSTGFDGLFVIKPDGRMYIQSGIGNLGTESMSDMPTRGGRNDRHAVGEGRAHLGRHGQEPAVDLRLGRQPDDARADARGACGGDRCDQEAAGDRREDARRQAGRLRRRRTNACRGGGGSMTLAQAAQKAIELGGKYDGHELPKDINAFTKASATALAGQGLMGVARDNYPHDGSRSRSSPASPKSKSMSKPASTTSSTTSPSPTSAR